MKFSVEMLLMIKFTKNQPFFENIAFLPLNYYLQPRSQLKNCQTLRMRLQYQLTTIKTGKKICKLRTIY